MVPSAQAHYPGARVLDAPTMPTAEQCWDAVGRRDTAADGCFVYAVRTTGVYCRPSCPSRLPKRENVTFYPDPGAADAAGYRSCKRCQPTAPSSVTYLTTAIHNACALIHESEQAPTLAALSVAVGISRFHLHRLFKQVTGTTPRQYARTCRLNRLAWTLDTGITVGDAALSAGYGSNSRAYETVSSGLGMTPAARRSGGAGETIRYATGKTDVGWMLIAATKRGICASELGNQPQHLIRRLTARFPAAVIRRDTGSLQRWSAHVARAIAIGEPLNLPLDIRGTAFQARVWRALQAIPPGKTASYASIAAAIGRPTAVRAVARACASNGLAVLVPCHRVVRSNGTLGGYRWGAMRKRALLAREHGERRGDKRRIRRARG
jgi:AraC family transcriptional regulator of adaptative response/methylated-DNA-[protein]-cysteine methyltransferase